MDLRGDLAGASTRIKGSLPPWELLGRKIVLTFASR
jgi:hypothetical protein